MKTQEFKGDVENLKYGINTYKNRKGEEVEQYYVRLGLQEVRKGQSKKTRHHKGILFLTKDQYDDKFIEIGDRLLVSDKVDWESREYFYSTTRESIIKEKLKDEYERNNVKIGKDNKPYWVSKDYAYSFRAKVYEITIFEKKDEVAYWQVNGVKFYFSENDAHHIFDKDNCYAKYILKSDFGRLADYKKAIEDFTKLNGETVEAKLFVHKNKKLTTNVCILISFDKNVNEYFINLVKEDNQGE